jgi:hypothetical protein
MKMIMVLPFALLVLALAGCESSKDKEIRIQEQRDCMTSYAAAGTGIITKKIREHCTRF